MAVELKVGIGAETTELKAGLKDAEAQINKFLDNVVTIGKVGEKLQSIGTKLSVGVTAPIVALSTVALKAFSDLEGVRTAFERLNDPTLLDNLRKATKGTTSDLELMQAAVKSEKFGLSTNALPTLLEYAGRVAKDTGQEVSYLVESITTGIGRKSPLILDNLGISASQLKAELGGVSMEAASVATVTEAVGRIAARELAKMGKDTKTLSESWLQVKTAINNSMGKIGEIISKNLDISGIIDKLTGYINSAVSAFENLSPGIQKAILVVVGLVAAAGPLLVVVGSIMAVLPSVVAGFGLFSVALTAMTGPIGLVVLGIGAIIAAVVGNWGKIKPYILNTINYFRELYNESIVVRIAVAGIAVMFKNAFSAIINILKTAYEVFKSFAKNTATLFSGVGSIIEGALTLDASKIKEGVGKIGVAYVSTLSDVGKDIKNGVKNLLTDVGTNLMGGLSSVLNDGKLKPITDLNIFDEKAIVKKEETKLDSITDKLKKKKKEKLAFIELEPIDTSALKASFDKSIKDVTEYQTMLRNLYYDNAQSINNSIASIPLTLTAAQIATQEAGLKFTEALQNIVDEGIVFGITDAFSAMGEAMFNGGDIIAAAGASILGTLGQFLNMLGVEMVKLGVGTIALGSLVQGIKSFLIANPGAAIALGAIAVAAGAMLSSASKSISGGGSKGGGGTAPTSGGAGSQSYSSSFSGGGNGGGEFVFRISGNDLVTVTDRARDKNLRIGG